jgi:hypothetical protein
MNERMLELYRQAQVPHTAIDPSNNMPYETTCFSAEKFAELIVRECGKVITNGGYWSGGPLGPKRQCTPPEIAQMIKEHFGVD